MPKTIVLANHKGGVGKTTATANIGAALAEAGHRVLVVDLDPQGHLGDMFGVQPDGRPRLEQVMLRQAAAGDAVVKLTENLSVLPCSEELAEAQFTVAAEEDSTERLAEALASLDEFDYVLLDSPPGIGFWSGLALLTADFAVIPSLAEELAVLSSGKIADFIDQHVSGANPDLRLLGVVITQAKPKRWRLMRESSERFALDELRELARIPRVEDAARTIRHGKPLFWLKPDGPVAAGYRQLAEIIEHETVAVTR